MAQIVRTDAPFSHLLDDLAKPCETVGRLRTSLRWNRKANWLAPDDGRRSPAGSAIKTFSAKDHSHGNEFLGLVVCLREGATVAPDTMLPSGL